MHLKCLNFARSECRFLNRRYCDPTAVDLYAIRMRRAVRRCSRLGMND